MMKEAWFQHILVPLDGSAHAESAIPVAAHIARASGGVLLLVRVVAYPDDATTEYHTASAYVEQQAQRAELGGLPIQTQILTGLPDARILTSIESQKIDLVVMSSQGETGLKRWAFGSVAQKVLQHSRASVLILRESAGPLSNLHPEGLRPVRVLVALDGSSLAETALAPAAALSAALSPPEQGSLHLVRVLPLPPPTNAVEATSGVRQLDLSAAQTSLQVTAEALQDRGNLSLTTSVVAHPDVAETLIRIAEEGVPVSPEHDARDACDIIALTTHGRSGPARWIMGSIAERVLDGTRLPLFVVHPSWPKED